MSVRKLSTLAMAAIALLFGLAALYSDAEAHQLEPGTPHLPTPEVDQICDGGTEKMFVRVPSGHGGEWVHVHRPRNNKWWSFPCTNGCDLFVPVPAEDIYGAKYCKQKDPPYLGETCSHFSEWILVDPEADCGSGEPPPPTKPTLAQGCKNGKMSVVITATHQNTSTVKLFDSEGLVGNWGTGLQVCTPANPCVIEKQPSDVNGQVRAKACDHPFVGGCSGFSNSVFYASGAACPSEPSLAGATDVADLPDLPVGPLEKLTADLLTPEFRFYKSCQGQRWVGVVETRPGLDHLWVERHIWEDTWAWVGQYIGYQLGTQTVLDLPYGLVYRGWACPMQNVPNPKEDPNCVGPVPGNGLFLGIQRCIER